jgi:ubiquitin carboxyl-terminal hydrolase 5/13
MCKYKCLAILFYFKFCLSLVSCFRSSDEIVRPRVPLAACLANYSAPEEIQDYYSTALKAKTTALKYAF